MEYLRILIKWEDAGQCSDTCNREEVFEHDLISIEQIGYFLGRRDGKFYIGSEIVCREHGTIRNFSVIPEEAITEIWVLEKKRSVGLGELDRLLGNEVEKPG
jgi:hypothetical protein